MAAFSRTRKTIAGLLTGAMLVATSGVHAASLGPDGETAVDQVTVIGGRVAPTTEDPKSATCEFLAAIDPSVLGQVQAARNGGDPFFMADLGPALNQSPPPKSDPSPLFASRVFQPTRYPVNVDWDAQPQAAPGAALPDIPRQYRGVTTRLANGADITTETGTQRLYDVAAPKIEAGLPQFTIDDAISACRLLRTIGGTTGLDWASGKYEIAYRDKFLPTAFALFDQHRYAESLDYFQRAFAKLSYDMGGDEAALMIGKLKLGAPGVKQDTAGAVAWLKKAGGAAFNPIVDMPVFDPREPGRNTAIGEAAMILGQLYQTGGAGVEKDPAQARKWFERARYVGHVRACLVLGDIYASGQGAPRDLKTAFRYYREGATFGDAPAQQALAEMYYSGDAPGGRNLRLAAAWHNEAAKIGHAPSLFALANAFEKGEGVPANAERALGLYKLAALEGSVEARNTLGAYFYDGTLLPKDRTLARQWFQNAAIGGDPDAMYNLGAMLMKGEGGEVDRTRAWVWLKIAQKGRNPNAAAAVNVLEARMTADEKAEAARLLGPANS